MLQVDLGQLDRQRRLRIGASVPADDAMWATCQPAEGALGGSVEVRLEAQRLGSPRDACRVGSERLGSPRDACRVGSERVAGDVVVRGTLAGMADLACCRCLTPVSARFKEEVTLLFRAGLDPRDAEDQETYALPLRERTLDLTDAVREHVLLALPRFALCDEACRGLCSHCGRNLNHGACECAPTDVDDRWAALRRLARH